MDTLLPGFVAGISAVTILYLAVLLVRTHVDNLKISSHLNLINGSVAGMKAVTIL